MTINKIIILFAIVIILFGGFVYYQFGNKGPQIKKDATIAFNAKTLDIEIVKSEKDMEIGLTKYSAISDNQGMLFVFDKPQVPGFWMKNMKFPIDMVFLNGDTVVGFVENAKVPAPDEKEVQIYRPESLVTQVLEVNDGLIKKYNINKGDRVKITPVNAK